MAFVTADRVKETTSTSGTGTYTLAGAVTGFQSFAAIGNGNTCYYGITDGTDWEVGLGTYTSAGTTLARTTILASSNGGAAVNWAAVSKQIWADAPALFFSGLTTSASAFSPSADDGKALGTTSQEWSDVFLASGGVINWASGNVTLTQSSGALALAGSSAALLDISASVAGQIKFPATQNPSANANTLDDYEEGTWTPTLTFGGAGTGISYSAQTGIYTKIGNIVVVSAHVLLTSKGSATGAAVIGGLPFTVSSAASFGTVFPFYGGMSSITGIILGYLGPSLTTIQMFLGGSTGASAISNSNFSNTTEIQLTAVYIV